jgi:predicted RNA-binding Zn ribbon-like protein
VIRGIEQKPYEELFALRLHDEERVEDARDGAMEVEERGLAPGDLRLVQEFVNTRNIETGHDDLASPDLLAAWLERRGLVAGKTFLTEADWQQAVRAREALRAALLANNGAAFDADALDTLNRAARDAPLLVRVQPDGGAGLEVSASGVQGAIGRLLAVMFTAMINETWSRLKACRNDSCEWAFYDHSKNRSGTWCSMAVCGNRTKTRAYRQRARASNGRP